MPARAWEGATFRSSLAFDVMAVATVRYGRLQEAASPAFVAPSTGSSRANVFNVVIEFAIGLPFDTLWKEAPVTRGIEPVLQRTVRIADRFAAQEEPASALDELTEDREKDRWTRTTLATPA
ncbi:hypothetical protein ACWPKO_23550 (plasmid) [Coraliomargarita sp. W4R53]